MPSSSWQLWPSFLGTPPASGCRRPRCGRLDVQLREARIDWRDVLVAAGLAHEDWPERLDTYLGPAGADA